MKETLRQIEMGWNRGFQLGLVAGGIGSLVIGGLFIGFFFGGVFFSKPAETTIISEKDITMRHLKMEGLENLDMEYIKYTVNKRVEEERIADEEEKIKRKEESEKRRLEFERDREQWLIDNPPVKELFDGNKRDLEYTISYIRKNWYHGDCALVWRSDIICWDFGGNKLIFPTQRPE
ncbi:MAG: hypothetical protein KJI69_04925 [Patescibacteria group bacterium]|nr:hypothetical protein [Patescibacteria group bacterium]